LHKKKASDGALFGDQKVMSAQAENVKKCICQRF